jgi:hypothetical protein
MTRPVVDSPGSGPPERQLTGFKVLGEPWGIQRWWPNGRFSGMPGSTRTCSAFLSWEYVPKSRELSTATPTRDEDAPRYSPLTCSPEIDWRGPWKREATHCSPKPIKRLKWTLVGQATLTEL